MISISKRSGILEILFSAVLALTVVGCKKDKDKTPVGAGAGVVPLEQSDILQMPISSSTSQSLSEGLYLLSEIKTFVEYPEATTTAGFTHTLITPGKLAKDDHLRKAAKWGPVESGNILQATVEMNVPEELLISTEGRPQQSKTHYYWHYSRNDGSWAWRASPGRKFDARPDIGEMMEQAKGGNNEYEALFQQEGSTLYFWVQSTRGENKLTIRVAYKNVGDSRGTTGNPPFADPTNITNTQTSLLGKLQGQSLKIEIHRKLNLNYISAFASFAVAFRSGRTIDFDELQIGGSYCALTHSIYDAETLAPQTVTVPSLKIPHYGTFVNGVRLHSFPEVLFYSETPPSEDREINIRCLIRQDELPLSLETLNAYFGDSVRVCLASTETCR